MIHRRERRRLLSPVLSDVPLVGENLTRRLRIVLLCVLAAFLLTNVTSYLIGQAVQAEANRDVRAEVGDLRREVLAEIDARRVQRDAERAELEAAHAAQQRELAQVRRDLCVTLDRLPRDAEVTEARRRHGCTGGTRPAGSATPGNATAPPPGSPDRPDGGPAPRPSPGPPGSPRPPANPGPPPPTNPPDDGLVCLPLVGCLL